MKQGLQEQNQKKRVAEWAERITACRNSELSVVQWCKENGICPQTYYRWQRRMYEMARQEISFVEITPALNRNAKIVIRINGAEVEVPSGMDAETVEAVLRVMKQC